MPRKNEYGRYILSAGEIGAYTVCPESWRLREVERAKSAPTATSNAGRELHAQWIKKFEEVDYLQKRIRLVVALFVIAFSVYLLTLTK